MTLDNVELTLVDSSQTASDFVHWLQQRRPSLGVDTETGGFVFFEDKLRLVQFGDPLHGWALPYEDWRGLIKEAFEIVDNQDSGSGPKLILHNAPFDIKFILHNGLTPDGRWPWDRTYDTMTLAGLTDPGGARGLKPLAAKLVDPRAATASKHLDNTMRENKWKWSTVPITHQPYWAYGALDPVLTTRLFDELANRPYSQEAYDMELATLRVVTGMMLKGVQVDIDYCYETINKLNAFITESRAYLRDEYGLENATSDQQIVSKLTALGVNFPEKFTKAGRRSVDKEVLGAVDHPIAQQVLLIKQSQKMVSTYLENFVSSVDSQDRVHPTIWATGARTGRNTITDPALQTLKKKGGIIRNAFVPAEGHKLVSIDADQIEARLAAHFSNDPGMIAAFHSEDDFFTELAKKVFHDEEIKKGDPRRQLTKTIVYAKLYGGGAEVMSRQSGVPLADIKQSINAFDSAYPGITRLQRNIEATARRRLTEEGEAYVTTPLGRRLVADDSREYALTNYLIQGHAAEVFKQAVLKVDAAGFGDYLLLPIHDEILFEVPEDEADEVLRTALEVMNSPSGVLEYAAPITWSGEVIDGAWGTIYV